MFQKWLEAIEAHSAFSTHYCSQDQDSEEDEDEVISLTELTESLQVGKELCIIYSDEYSILKKVFKKKKDMRK